MANSSLEPPASDEIEISVIGPGYGEAIVLHVGGGRWILIDSCIDPRSATPASLSYLDNLGVSLDSVQLIVATHWHDDHVCGLGTVFEQCREARLVIPQVLETDQFLSLLALYSGNPILAGRGVDEFARVFQLLKDRRQKGERFGAPKFASADRIIYSDHLGLKPQIAEIKIHALSPSDSAIQQAQLALGALMPQTHQKRLRIASPRPNLAAVVLWVSVGYHHLLLGADLEETSDPRTGWSVIVTDSCAVGDKASVFKVPHHGSQNAHSAEVWSKLLTSDPVAVVTPFRRGGTDLPSPGDIKRIASLTPRAYMTARVRMRRPRFRDGAVRRMVQGATRSIQDLRYCWGHVRLRKAIGDSCSSWRVELFGDAHRLSAA